MGDTGGGGGVQSAWGCLRLEASSRRRGRLLSLLLMLLHVSSSATGSVQGSGAQLPQGRALHRHRLCDVRAGQGGARRGDPHLRLTAPQRPGERLGTGQPGPLKEGPAVGWSAPRLLLLRRLEGGVALLSTGGGCEAVRRAGAAAFGQLGSDFWGSGWAAHARAPPAGRPRPPACCLSAPARAWLLFSAGLPLLALLF